MNKEIHAEFIKLIEKIEGDNMDYYGHGDEIKRILDYDIRLEIVKASIMDISLEI